MTTLMEPLTGLVDITLKFGRNSSIDAATDEDIWDAGGDHALPTAARVHAIVSNSENDTSDGTGARTVEIYGLDGDYNPISETVIFNGTTPVNSVNSYLRLYRMIVRTAGSGGQNAGIITATAATDATVTAQINAGNNQTLMAIWTSPAGSVAHLHAFYASLNKAGAAGSANIFLLVRPPGQVWQIKLVYGLQSTGTSSVTRVYNLPYAFPEKTDFRVRADVTANSSDISAGFDMQTKEPY